MLGKGKLLFLLALTVIALVLVALLYLQFSNIGSLRENNTNFFYVDRPTNHNETINISSASNSFKITSTDLDRKEDLFESAQQLMKSNNVTSMSLQLVDEPQPDKVRYEGSPNYFISSYYMVENGALNIKLNINSKEFNRLRAQGWNNESLSNEVEYYFYLNLFKALSPDKSDENIRASAKKLLSKLDANGTEKLLTLE